MRNVTVTIPDDAYRRARVSAAPSWASGFNSSFREAISYSNGAQRKDT
jgi:hypothetical protein